MKLEQVITILESVAGGIDPNTGEVIQSDVFHAPEVIRAFYTAVDLLRNPASGRSTTAAAVPMSPLIGKPASAGKPWSDEEDARLCSEYDAATSIHDIAEHHGRTRGAITSRLVRLGKIDPDTVRVRERVRPAS